MTSVSVIIPTHNGGEAFKKCLGAILEASPPPHEIIVVDDGSSEDLPAVSAAASITLLRLKRQGGPARARNAGAAASTGTVLFFIDADVVIPPDTVGQVRDLFDRNGEIDAIFGSYDDTPLETDLVSQYRNLLHHYVHQESNVNAATFWGACGAVRREAFEAVGGFDAERYLLPSIEDVEFGQRLAKAGFTIRLQKTLQVKHLKKWRPVSLLRTDFFQRALPWTDLVLSDGFKNDLNTTVRDRLSVLLVFGFVLSLASAPLIPTALLVAAACGAGLLALNWRLYRFFAARRGLPFALLTIPWHWLQFLSSGIAFAWGVARHLWRLLFSSRDVQTSSIDAAT